MKSDMVKPLVIGILAVQAVTVALAWLLNAFSVETTAAFALLLAANVTAFALVAQVYRMAKNEAIASTVTTSSSSPAPAEVVGVPYGPMGHESDGATLPSSVKMGVPIASILVLLAFAITIALPPDKAPIPTQSTFFFIPIYVAIVIVLVLGSMYLFKAIMESDMPKEEHQSSQHS